MCCNVHSENDQVKIEPATGFEDNCLHFYQGDEIFRPLQLQPDMRPDKARLNMLEGYLVFTSVSLVVLFIPIYVSVMGLRGEWYILFTKCL
jgi:hypothetical protein